MRSAINTALFILFLLLAFLTSVASYADEPLCPIGIQTGSKTWTWSKYGNSPYICVRSCRYAVVASVCTDTLDACSSDFISTGVVCSDPDSMVSGGEYPDIPTPPDDSIPIFNGSNPDSASVFTAKNLYKLDYSRSFGKLNNRIDNTYKALDSRFSNLSTDMSQARTTVSDAASRLNVATKSIHSLSDNITSMSGDFVRTRNLINSKHDELISDNDITHENQEVIKKSVLDNTYGINTAITFLSRLENKVNADFSVLKNESSETYFNAIDIKNKLRSLSESIGINDPSLPPCSDYNNLPPGFPLPPCNGSPYSLNGKIDGLSSSIASLSSDVQDFLSTGSYVNREFQGKVDFDTVGLYKPDLLESVLADTEELKQQYEQQIDEFKKIFSFDVSQLNSGQYKEHSLDFVLPDGKRLNLKSGVLPALVDQANLIAAVILFVAAIIAVKAILGSRK